VLHDQTILNHLRIEARYTADRIMVSTTIIPAFKPAVVHTEDEELGYGKTTAELDDATGKVFSVDDVDLPQGYYKSPYFWGSMGAIGLSISCGVAGFSFVAPLLSFVNADIGPSENITWLH